MDEIRRMRRRAWVLVARWWDEVLVIALIALIALAALGLLHGCG